MAEHCKSLLTDTARRPSPSRAKVFHITVLVSCTLTVLGSLLLSHRGDGLGLLGIEWPVGCALYQNFGVKCALCGITRSFSSIAKGDVPRAAQFHSLGPALFVFVCLQIPYRISALSATQIESRKLRFAGIYVAVVLAAAFLINWFVYLGGLVL
ncbi:MAG: DUF2752 domain-containing protein [Planctomycetota bacterium]|jgi:hypothetical protein